MVDNSQLNISFKLGVFFLLLYLIIALGECTPPRAVVFGMSTASFAIRVPGLVTELHPVWQPSARIAPNFLLPVSIYIFS